MASFNWDDHPVAQSATPQAASGSQSKGFSWDDHPVAQPAKNQDVFGPGGKSAEFFDNHPIAKSVGHWITGALPLAGGVFGGAAGGLSGAAEGLAAGPAAPVVSPGLAIAQGVGGAGAGAAAGSVIKDNINSQVFGDKMSAGDIAKNAATEGATMAVGEGVGRAAAPYIKAAIPVVGSAMTGVPIQDVTAYLSGAADITKMAANNGLESAAKVIQLKNANVINKTVAGFEAPVTDIIKNRVTNQSDKELGDQVKQTIAQRINEEHAQFGPAFQMINDVHDALPIADESRLKLTDGLKEWALDKMPQSGDSYKLVQKHADNFNASNTGAQFKSALGDLSSDLSAAYKAGDSQKIGVLTEIQNKANQFMDDQFTGLAKRVSKGVETPAEAEAFSKIVENTNYMPKPGESTVGNFKTIANNYLDSVDKINKEYSGFKKFLGEIQDQTGAKGFGASTVLKGLNDIPSEKLVSKLFNPKNAENLQMLKTQMPEVFDKVSSAEMRDMAAAATDKSGAVDVNKFIQKIDAMPKEARELMFSKEELEAVNSVKNNPKLQRINEVVEQMGKGVHTPGETIKHLIDSAKPGSEDAKLLGELSNLTGVNLVSDAQKLSAASTIGSAGPKSMLQRSGMAAAGGELLGNSIGLPKVGAVAGAVGGAMTSPFALKKGIDMVNSRVGQSFIGQGATSLGSSLLQGTESGNSGVKSLKQAGQE